MSDDLTFGSLFAGVGGFDLGFEAAGYRCGFQVEWDAHCQQVLAHHWPDVPRWGDVSTVSGYDLPPVDVITYGFPCQDLSVAGKRAGLDGQRSHLFFEAVRIIREMREATDGRYPTWAVAENVAGLLNADGGSAMARVLDELAEAGALVIEWATLDAQWFGVPQRRRRVFVAACLDPRVAERCPDPLFPVGESGIGNPAPMPDLVGFYSKQGKYDRPMLDGLPALVIGTGLGIATSCAVVGKSLSPRRLTPRESERAMGWPDDHTLHLADGGTATDVMRYRMTGNGVVAPVARWVAKHLARTLR